MKILLFLVTFTILFFSFKYENKTEKLINEFGNKFNKDSYMQECVYEHDVFISDRIKKYEKDLLLEMVKKSCLEAKENGLPARPEWR